MLKILTKYLKTKINYYLEKPESLIGVIKELNINQFQVEFKVIQIVDI